MGRKKVIEMKSIVLLEYKAGETLNEFYFDTLETCNYFIKLRNLKEENCVKRIIGLITINDLERR